MSIYWESLPFIHMLYEFNMQKCFPIIRWIQILLSDVKYLLHRVLWPYEQPVDLKTTDLCLIIDLVFATGHFIAFVSAWPLNPATVTQLHSQPSNEMTRDVLADTRPHRRVLEDELRSGLLLVLPVNVSPVNLLDWTRPHFPVKRDWPLRPAFA